MVKSTTVKLNNPIEATTVGGEKVLILTIETLGYGTTRFHGGFKRVDDSACTTGAVVTTYWWEGETGMRDSKNPCQHDLVDYDRVKAEIRWELECGTVEVVPEVEDTRSVLEIAQDLTSNTRKDQYGEHTESFGLYSQICDLVYGITLTPIQVAQVMQAIKLGRHAFQIKNGTYKRDNLIDLPGYIRIEDELRRSGN